MEKQKERENIAFSAISLIFRMRGVLPLKIVEVPTDKKQYLNLLLLADEQESMIDRYLEDGIMYALFDNDVKAICVVRDEGEKVLEIKNIAVKPDEQKKGYGKCLIQFIRDQYRGDFNILQAGTGESPRTLLFYEKCGFQRSHIVKNFFIDYYDHLIYEEGVQLVDMVYLQMKL